MSGLEAEGSEYKRNWNSGNQLKIECTKIK
jgi:hypothetical protein